MSEGVGFGNYRLLRRLARGGMAEVFLARQQGVEGFERRVAIKRILPHLSDSVEFRTMFLDEARLAAQLSHPNIIHIYDFGKVDDYYFIAMEYVDGVDLGRMIKHARTVSIPFELCAKIFADICAGLHYAHNISDGAGKRLNVVHRDVTPQNVLVTYDGIVKVVDFGIAKATWQASRTRPGVVKGKYAYMSPEQVEGRALDARSDIYSVGICLYEVMTGQPLYRRDNVTEAMKEIRDGKPVHPEKHRADIPYELMAVLKRALSTTRDERYSSAAAMQLDLERYLKNATNLATPQLVGDFLQRETPRLSEGEPLVEPKSEDILEPTPAPRGGASASGVAGGGGAAVKGGTAQISNMKAAVTPAYERSPAEPPATTSPTRESGKSLRITFTEADAKAPTGFADPADDDLTRKDESPTEMSTNALTRPDHGKASSQARAATTDNPAPPRSGSLAARPPGRGSRSDITSSLANPRTKTKTKIGWTLPVIALVAVGVSSGVFVRRHLLERPAIDRGTSLETTRDLGLASDAAVRADANTDTRPTEPKIITTSLPVQTSATIAVYTAPSGAKVFIDGQALEMLTPVRMQPITTGPHHVVIERTGYQPRELDVSLKAGDHQRLDFELPEERSLQPSPKIKKDVSLRVVGNGFFTAKTVPWSRAYEGSRLLGETPLANVPLSEGTHTITFVNPELPPVKKKVVVRVGEETKLNVALSEP